MKILVAGGLGFIGSAFIRRSIKLGHKILNIDKLTYAANKENLQSIAANPSYEFQKIDIENYQEVYAVLNNFSPDIVINFAAETHVDNSIVKPKNFITTNVLGTYNLLEISRDYWFNKKKFEHFRYHQVSTDEVFGSLQLNTSNQFDEKTAYSPRSPYSASKASSDHLVAAWHATYGLPTLITNCSNNYGPFQHIEKLIPVIILNAYFGKMIPIYGEGINVRDWLHVDDHVNALLDVLQFAEPGAKYVIGGQNEFTNLTIAKSICSIIDKKLCRSKEQSSQNYIKLVNDRPGHDLRYAVDINKIKTDLGWEPKIGFIEGLESTVDWYIKNLEWCKAALSKKQEMNKYKVS